MNIIKHLKIASLSLFISLLLPVAQVAASAYGCGPYSSGPEQTSTCPASSSSSSGSSSSTSSKAQASTSSPSTSTNTSTNSNSSTPPSTDTGQSSTPSSSSNTSNSNQAATTAQKPWYKAIFSFKVLSISFSLLLILIEIGRAHV